MRFDEHIAVATAFGRSLLAWQLEARPRLLSATFAVTNRCNLRCSYCNTPFLDPSELDSAQVERLLDRLALLGVKRLGLAGGEPLLRKDIGDIVEMAKERGFLVTMNTNMMLYARRRKETARVNLFFTSIDGDKTAHEAARGRGAYRGVLEAVDAIVADGRKVIAICVVTEHSIEMAAKLLDMAEKHGIRIHFQPQCTGTEVVRGNLASSLTNEGLRRFWRELLEQKRAARAIANSVPYLKALSQWDDFEDSAVHDPTTRCAASRGFLYIDPQGQGYPCAYTKCKVAPVNMLSDDWQSAVGQKTPCTRCSVGPYLEFNLLYQQPLRAAWNVLQSYA